MRVSWQYNIDDGDDDDDYVVSDVVCVEMRGHEDERGISVLLHDMRHGPYDM